MGLDDISNEYTEYDLSNFLTMIVRINMIYECVKAIVGDQFNKSDNMLYFKFIRDTLSHPNELNNRAYQKIPYQPYMKYIFVDFYNLEQVTKHFGFSKNIERLFDKEDDEFALKMDNPDTGNLIFLVCPYSKIWYCLYELIQQLVDFLSNN